MIKHVFATLAGLALLLPTLALAEDDHTVDPDTKIAELEAYIAELETKIETLEARLEKGDHVAATFTRTLTIGDRGDDVMKLQALLASDPSVYPEGLSTGYFGALTQAALQRFRAQYDLHDDVLPFGEQTRAFVNAIFAGHADVFANGIPAGFAATHDFGHHWKAAFGEEHDDDHGHGDEADDDSMTAIERLLLQIRAGKTGEELKDGEDDHDHDDHEHDEDADHDEDEDEEVEEPEVEIEITVSTRGDVIIDVERRNSDFRHNLGEASWGEVVDFLTDRYNITRAQIEAYADYDPDDFE